MQLLADLSYLCVWVCAGCPALADGSPPCSVYDCCRPAAPALPRPLAWRILADGAVRARLLRFKCVLSHAIARPEALLDTGRAIPTAAVLPDVLPTGCVRVRGACAPLLMLLAV